MDVLRVWALIDYIKSLDKFNVKQERGIITCIVTEARQLTK